MKSKKLSLKDLKSITWDYSSKEELGYFNGILVNAFSFKVIKYNNTRHPFTIRRCNVQEGWIEFVELTGKPFMTAKGYIHYPPPVYDEHLNVKRVKVKCRMKVNILSSTGKIVKTLWN